MPARLARAVFIRIAAGAAAALCAVSSWSVPLPGPYRLQDISGNGAFQRAEAVNNEGAVVGLTENGFGGYHWSAATGLTRIADPAFPGHVSDPVRGNAYAFDINNQGQAIGNWAPQADIRPFSYTQAGGPRDLGINDARAVDITDSGRVLGSIWRDAGQDYFIIEPDGSMTVHRPPVALQALVGLRDDGSVIANREGGAQFSSRVGILSGDQWQDIPGIGGVRSQAFGFNQEGAIVGSIGVDVPGDYIMERAFAYTPDGGVVDLAAGLGPDLRYSVARSVNSHGLVVGYGSRGPDSEVFSYIHDLSTGSFLDLSAVVWPSTLEGWTHLIFTDINDSGQIAGYGLYNEQPRAFLMTPAPPVPEPSAVLLMAAGGLLVGLVRRRSVSASVR